MDGGAGPISLSCELRTRLLGTLQRASTRHSLLVPKGVLVDVDCVFFFLVFGYVLECSPTTNTISSRICDVPLPQQLKIGFRSYSSVQPFHSCSQTRALLENMRFSAFVIAIVFVSYVGYGMRHGMDDDKEEPGWWLKRHPVLFSLENMGLSRNEVYTVYPKGAIFMGMLNSPSTVYIEVPTAWHATDL